MKLGLIQMHTGCNVLQKLREHIAQVKDADIVILPEIFNAPYSNEGFIEYSEGKGGKTYTELSNLAKEFGVYLIGGSIPEREGDKIYNTSLCFLQAVNK